MSRVILIFLCCLIYSTSYGNKEYEKIKFRKLSYTDFKKLSINDTSDAIVDLFFRKKDNAVFDQMSLLPISIILTFIPPIHFVGIATGAISVPLFLNGSFVLVKYRKKKLYNVLMEYQKTNQLPKWVRKKTNRILGDYEIQQINY